MNAFLLVLHVLVCLVLILVVLPVIYSLLVPTKERERTFRLWQRLWQRLLHDEN